MFPQSSLLGIYAYTGGVSGFGGGTFASAAAAMGDSYSLGWGKNPYGIFEGIGNSRFMTNFFASYDNYLRSHWAPPPVFLPAQPMQDVPVAPAGGGAPAAASNIEGTTKPEKTEKKTISEETKGKAITKLKTDMGYSEEEANSIASKAAAKADGDSEKFGRILTGIPPKTVKQKDPKTQQETEKKNDRWSEDFGNWYAENILGMDKEAAKDYVRSVALEPDTKAKGKGKGKAAKLDYLAVVPEKKTETDGSGKIYDIYDIEAGSAVGKNATAASKGTDKLYSNEGKWYKKQGGKFKELKPQPAFNPRTGKLSFGAEPAYKSQDGYDADRLDARDYITKLDEGAPDQKKRIESRKEGQEGQRTARVLEVASKIKTKFGKEADGSDKMQVNVTPDGKTIELTSKPEKAEALAGELDRNEKLKQELNSLLKQLPAGTRMLLNGNAIIGSDRAKEVVRQLRQKPSDAAQPVGASPASRPGGQARASGADSRVRVARAEAAAKKADAEISEAEKKVASAEAAAKGAEERAEGAKQEAEKAGGEGGDPESVGRAQEEATRAMKEAVAAKAQIENTKRELESARAKKESDEKALAAAKLRQQREIKIAQRNQEAENARKLAVAQKQTQAPAQPKPTMPPSSQPARQVQPSAVAISAPMPSRGTPEAFPKAVSGVIPNPPKSTGKEPQKATVQAGKIKPPTDKILAEPYEVAGHKVDFMLPDDMKKKLKAELPKWKFSAEVYAKNKTQKNPDIDYQTVYTHHLLQSFARWAREETKNWKLDNSGNSEDLSLLASIDKKKGECSEKTNFLYAAMMYAKKSEEVGKDLKDVKFGFAQVYRTHDGKRQDHGCLTARLGTEKTVLYDIAYPEKLGPFFERFNVEHKEFAPVDLETYVATLLCNKGKEMLSKKQDAQAKKLYDAAENLAQKKNAFVLFQVATYYYNKACSLQKSNRALATEYAGTANDLLNQASRAEGGQTIQKFAYYRRMRIGMARLV